MSNPLAPSPAVLSKLGSLAIHAEEMISEDGHAFDRSAIESLLSDQELREWIRRMDELALLPKKRKG